MLQENIQIMGGDPFQSSNGALQQLDQLNYSYGLFNNPWPINYYDTEFYKDCMIFCMQFLFFDEIESCIFLSIHQAQSIKSFYKN